MSCEAPDLRQNLDLAIERQKKILDLIYEWYKQVVSVDPPPVTDPSILSYNSKVSYYYTSDVQNLRKVLKLVEQGLTAAVGGLPGVVIDFDSIVNLVAETLVGTTRHATPGEGYGTCVMKGFPGEIGGKKCIFRPMVVAIAFSFPASEYHTSAPVTAFGYWVYLFVTEPKSEEHHHRHHHHFKSIKGHTLTFELPTDIDIVGKRFMTKEELDMHRPTSFTRDH